jgi:hypothetical protein
MKGLSKTAKIMFVIFAIIITALVYYLINRDNDDKEKYPGSLVITEILPSPGEGEHPWIELYNPLDKKVNASGLEIVIDDTYRYSIPGELPPVPPKGFIIFQLDGKGKEANLYRYRDNAVLLHSPAGFQAAMDPKSGQVGLYMKSSTGTRKVIRFVSWGAPGSRESLTPERHRIWRAEWFISTTPNFGIYTPGIPLREGFSIGLFPGSKTMTPEDWAIYSQEETTRGEQNRVSTPILFPFCETGVLLHDNIVLRWMGNQNARGYRFQLSRDENFNSIIDEKEYMDIPLYKYNGDEPWEDGKYYHFRVKLIDNEGMESEWSRGMFKVRRLSIKKEEATMLSGMSFKYQRKDTKLLCLDGCFSEQVDSTTKHWDKPHPAEPCKSGDHGAKNCVRACISMMVSVYGKGLSQDRIAYYTQVQRGSGTACDHIDEGPEGDLAHRDSMEYDYGNGEITEALEWALGINEDDGSETILFFEASPSFGDLCGWLYYNRPIMTRAANCKSGAHMRIIDGCWKGSSPEEEWVHILDPVIEERWELYSTWARYAKGTWVGPKDAPNAREDEPTIRTDSDGDGIMDFDEECRFRIDPNDKDYDNDGVHDKNDIRGYVFDANGNYDAADEKPFDWDSDGLRKEKDPDNDDDTYIDGCEDKNCNGKYEPDAGETDNFKVDSGLTCDSKPVHAIIVFDRSGSMVLPAADPVKKYDKAADAAVLFLDTWLANEEHPGTRVGLVFFDCSAYFDTGEDTDTTLDFLTPYKRDKIEAAFKLNVPDRGATSIGRGLLKAMNSDGFDIGAVPGEEQHQHRVVIVLTDGIENCGVRMDDPSVTEKPAAGQVAGYVLGIGEETQIDMDKLNELARILNRESAYFAKDPGFQLKEFFLQVLAETQELGISLDTVNEIAPGEVTFLPVPVSRGAERVTFVTAWNHPGVKLRVYSRNPLFFLEKPGEERTNTSYLVLTNKSPIPGILPLMIYAEPTGASEPPEKVRYSFTVLEKNPRVRSHFEVKTGSYRAGQPILLTAMLSKNRAPMPGAEVRVDVIKPIVGFENFVTQYAPKRRATYRSMKLPEENVVMDLWQSKCQWMAFQGLQARTAKTEITLKDDGKNGDCMAGDGTYSGYFNDTANDGLYFFRFMARSISECKNYTLAREKTISLRLKPKKSVK